MNLDLFSVTLTVLLLFVGYAIGRVSKKCPSFPRYEGYKLEWINDQQSRWLKTLESLPEDKREDAIKEAYKVASW